MEFAFTVDPDVTRARTLPSAFYLDPAFHALTRERVFARTWQWLGDLGDVAAPGSLSPREMLAGHLDEPLLLARDAAGELRCLSNVCTHRGNLLVRAPCRAEQIRCGYHSRRFDLAGRMTFMPGFEQAQDFPGPSDHLPRVPVRRVRGAGVRLARAGGAVRRLLRRHRRAPGMAAVRRASPRSVARPRFRDRRALGPVRRELPRGPAHPLPPSGAEPGARHGPLRVPPRALRQPAARARRATATRRSSCRRARPTTAGGSPPTTGGCSRT